MDLQDKNNDTNLEDENSIQDKNLIEDEDPIQDKNLIEDEDPIQDKNLIEDEDPIQDKNLTENENLYLDSLLENYKANDNDLFLDSLVTDEELTNSIIKNEDVFSVGYKPQILKEVLHRENEILKLVSYLKSVLTGIVPKHLFVHGKPGTGKTTLAELTLIELKLKAQRSGHDLTYVYVKCDDINTPMKVTQQIVRTLETKHNIKSESIATSTTAYFLRLTELVQLIPHPIIIILDEIDALTDPDQINSFGRMRESRYTNRNVCIIGITNNPEFLQQRLGGRTLAIFSKSNQIVTPPYDAPALEDILHDRAKKGLLPDTYNEIVIPLCAAFAAQEHGDARRAIDLLHTSALIAQNDHRTIIEEKDVKAALAEIEINRVIEVIEKLPTQSKLTLLSGVYLKENGYTIISTGLLYDIYKQYANYIGMDILTSKRVSDLISELDILTIFNVSLISKGRYGRTKEITIDVHVPSAKETIFKDYRLKPIENDLFKPILSKQSHFKL